VFLRILGRLVGGGLADWGSDYLGVPFLLLMVIRLLFSLPWSGFFMADGHQIALLITLEHPFLG
jgi:hypothetical protein